MELDLNLRVRIDELEKYLAARVCNAKITLTASRYRFECKRMSPSI